MSATRVVVIGGGLAGIAAALQAADRGAEVVLLERQARLGGLTWSFRRHGLWFDNGHHIFLRCCTAYRGLLDRLGVATLTCLQERLELPVLSPNGTYTAIRRSGLPAPLHLARSLLTYGHLSLTDRIRSGRAALSMRKLDPADPKLDEIALGQWLESHGQGDRAIEALWDLIALPTLNLHASSVSLALAAMVFKTGLLDSANAGDIGWSRVPLAHLHGDPAIAALEKAGVEVLLRTPAESVSTPKAGSGRFQVALRRSSGDIQADRVVVATSPQRAAKLLPAVRSPAFARLGTSAVVNIQLVLDRKVMDFPFAGVVDSPVQFVFDRTDSSGLRRGQFLTISLSAADSYMRESQSHLVSSFSNALEELFPAMRHARILDAVVTRERHATFRAAPGSAALRRAPVDWPDGVSLAGAWCDTGWPATMESAVRSGVRAVREVLS